jgi:mannose-1-phosphate guanylyltransferase/mannose-6-phosphate isomerase
MSNFITRPIPSLPPEVKLIERPWGSFKQYAHNEEVTVSLMTVKPGQRLSLQRHTARAELWIALDEGAKVEVDDQVFYPKAGEEIWIPVQGKHRLSSLEKPVRVLEIAFGNWQQDDIERFEDDYHRPAEGE